MHSSTELTSSMFDIQSDGRRVASFADLCPGFTAQDRLGIIIRQPLDAIWNSALILAAVTAFYDEQRKAVSDFFIYPDYFIFHAGCPVAEYSMFDIWPQHKCISVEDNPETLLQAVNDRAISILVLNADESHERESRESSLQRHTRNAALNRIRHAFLCSRHKRTRNADVRIKGNEIVEKYVEQVIDQTVNITQPERDAARHERRQAVLTGGLMECYQRISVAESLLHL